jgi:hypothetical protein
MVVLHDLADTRPRILHRGKAEGKREKVEGKRQKVKGTGLGGSI